MIQAAMYFALGLLAAGLLALLVTPAIWRRALRLARKRIEASVPMSRSEIEADKDQLRAGFAISTRRLELETGKLREKLAEETIATSRWSEEIAALTRSKATLAETITTMEARIAELGDSLAARERKLGEAAADLALRDQRLLDQEATLAEIRAELGASQLMTEELRLEMVARTTEIGNLGDNVAALTAAHSAGAAARDALAADIAAERDRFIAERKRVETLEAGLAVLQTERVGRAAQLERRAAEVKALETEIASERAARAELAAEIAAVRTERDQLAAELATEQRVAAELGDGLSDDAERMKHLRERLDAREAELHAARAQLAGVEQQDGGAIVADGDNFRKALAATEAEKEALLHRVAQIEDDLATLRAENAELRRVAGAEWESEREQNRRLRERLAEIAAGVVRLGQPADTAPRAIPDEPLGNDNGHEPTPQASAPVSLAPQPRTPAPAPGAEGDGPSLAERVRALQHAGTRH